MALILLAGPLKLFRARLAKAIEGATDILDVGTEQRFRKELRPLEHWFKDKNYKAAGYRPRKEFGAYNCDLDLDVCQIDLPDELLTALSVLKSLSMSPIHLPPLWSFNAS